MSTFREKLIDRMPPITVSGLDPSKVSAITAGVGYAYECGAREALLLLIEDAKEKGVGVGGMISTGHVRLRASELTKENT